MQLPHPMLLRLLLRRGLVLWAGARLVLWVGAHLVLLLMSRPPVAGSPAWHLGPAGTPWFLLLVAVVIWTDLRRRQEFVLLSNLGIAPVFAAMLGSLPALVGEIAIISLLP